MADAFKVVRSPYLFRKINEHLDHTDFPSCALVNRYWESLFGPLVWHTLTFSGEPHCDDLQPFHKNHVKTLNWKGLHIRRLHSHDCQSLLCFIGPQSRCCHLLELEFTACLTHESTAKAIQLICLNPELERLTIQGDFTLTRKSDVPQNLFSALHKHPALTHITLGTADTIDYDCRESETLGQNLTRIESLQIGNCPSLGQLNTVIATHWSSTLKELSFLRGTSVQSTDIQLLLTSCPLLTKFVVWPDKIRYGINGVAQQGCSGLKLSMMTGSSWVCLGLKQLGLRILDDRSVREGTTIEEKNQGTVIMRQALAQIGDLVVLQQLGLEWTSATKIDPKAVTLVLKDFVQMDFSLSCGLNLLGRLKQLRKLQVSMREIKVGQREMEWIVDNWPKLTVVAGLYRSSLSSCLKTTAIKDKEPAHIAWLREHRPSLTIL
ncbi:hypothetical protein BGZ95_007495 [Linnemannia exigua]|uniref:F-box domain-containing protein n=1 Tax=Linnemannia exigua TaxID=604196 RepID=A0AAD4DGT1_9FUNG|nr:hypothetical protein BGZ95_007495 [Linnemannia exigua]